MLLRPKFGSVESVSLLNELNVALLMQLARMKIKLRLINMKITNELLIKLEWNQYLLYFFHLKHTVISFLLIQIILSVITKKLSLFGFKIDFYLHHVSQMNSIES